jgi:hypothetical protein
MAWLRRINYWQRKNELEVLYSLNNIINGMAATDKLLATQTGFKLMFCATEVINIH